jgi:hypothetical protein
MKKLILLLIAVCFFSCATYAQVTVGSGIEPMKGALLDLKENAGDPVDNTTANLGMLLPRVRLNNPDPAAAAGTDGLAASIDGNAPAESWDLEDHIGLTVYNLTDDCVFCPGIYVWMGDVWERLPEPCCPDMDITVETTIGLSSSGDVEYRFRVPAEPTDVVEWSNKPDMETVIGTGPEFIQERGPDDIDIYVRKTNGCCKSVVKHVNVPPCLQGAWDQNALNKVKVEVSWVDYRKIRFTLTLPDLMDEAFINFTPGTEDFPTVLEQITYDPVANVCTVIGTSVVNIEDSGDPSKAFSLSRRIIRAEFCSNNYVLLILEPTVFDTPIDSEESTKKFTLSLHIVPVSISNKELGGFGETTLFP